LCLQKRTTNSGKMAADILKKRINGGDKTAEECAAHQAEAPQTPQCSCQRRVEAKSSALRFIVTRSPNDAVNLLRSENVRPFRLRLFVDDRENFGLWSCKPYIVTDTEEDRGGAPRVSRSPVSDADPRPVAGVCQNWCVPAGQSRRYSLSFVSSPSNQLISWIIRTYELCSLLATPFDRERQNPRIDETGTRRKCSG